MVFKGVPEEALDNWKGAQKRSIESVTDWCDVTGIDAQRANDKSLFRVLEWGGMEVLR